MWALDETALDLVQRTWYDHPFRSGIDVVDSAFPDGIKSRSVVEVYGDAQSPKSLLLHHLCAAYLAHDARAQVHYFDHECMMNVDEMKHIVEASVSSEREGAMNLESIMKRLFVYQCGSSDEWSASLRDIHTKLLKQSGVLLLIAVDCIGSFHLIDKMIQHRLQDTSYKKVPKVYMQLKDLVRQHSATIFAAKNNDLERGWKHTEYLPAEWTSLLTKRLHVRLLDGRGGTAPTYELKVDNNVRVFRASSEGRRLEQEHTA
ncbi:Aste57867_19962 [Aphanomyces stellatus]|uniref:Aste57867_19962 protein n=1 Tax=Aphanomyces stellatus TaxID=120398 RepID=A0A485LFS3_9STRA|nr:hypothetical protein As57867_019896 [Aphanomyces stellatus]VFT96659.1 Aste57867_19962 [Aphanomyces stellatus]